LLFYSYDSAVDLTLDCKLGSFFTINTLVKSNVPDNHYLEFKTKMLWLYAYTHIVKFSTMHSTKLPTWRRNYELEWDMFWTVKNGADLLYH